VLCLVRLCAVGVAVAQTENNDPVGGWQERLPRI
jgi:hypothetical protein